MRLTLLSNFVGLALVASASLAFASPTGAARDVLAANPEDELFARANQNNALANGKRCWANKQCKSGNCNYTRCHAKSSTGAFCYKAAGCSSDLCLANKCTPKTDRPNGYRCKTSSQCSSGRCHDRECKAKSKSPQPVTLTSSTSTAKPTAANATSTTTTSTSAATAASTALTNYADFSDGTLAPWTASDSNKVSIVSDPDSPGGKVVRLTVSADGTATTISRSNMPPGGGDTSVPHKRGEHAWIVSARFQWRVVSYKRTSGGCAFEILINGKNPGGQSFGRTPEELNKWFGTYNGNVQINDTEIHTLSLGPSCTVGDSVVVDLRNVTRVLEYAGGSD